MAAYLEEHELVVGTWYMCQDYDGGHGDYCYIGKGRFADEQGRVRDFGWIRYVFEPAASSAAGKSSEDRRKQGRKK